MQKSCPSSRGAPQFLHTRCVSSTGSGMVSGTGSGMGCGTGSSTGSGMGSSSTFVPQLVQNKCPSGMGFTQFRHTFPVTGCSGRLCSIFAPQLLQNEEFAAISAPQAGQMITPFNTCSLSFSAASCSRLASISRHQESTSPAAWLPITQRQQ